MFSDFKPSRFSVLRSQSRKRDAIDEADVGDCIGSSDPNMYPELHVQEWEKPSSAGTRQNRAVLIELLSFHRNPSSSGGIGLWLTGIELGRV
jgi:hypothetical protein